MYNSNSILMKKLLMLLSLLAFMQGCTKERLEGTLFSCGIELLVSDEQGRDLLNPTVQSPKAVDFSKVRMYYIRNGKEELFYRPNYDAPYGLGLIKPGMGETRYKLGVGTDCEETKEGVDFTTTILKWGDGHRDVIKTEIHRNERYRTIVQHKIWVNDKLVWDRSRDGDNKKPTYEIKR